MGVECGDWSWWQGDCAMDQRRVGDEGVFIWWLIMKIFGDNDKDEEETLILGLYYSETVSLRVMKRGW